MDFYQAVEMIRYFIEIKAGQTLNPSLVFTPNAEIVVKAHDDKEFFQILSSADLVVPDGSSLLWAAKMLKIPLKTRVTGIDLMQMLLTEAEKNHWTVYFLGAKPDTIEKACSNTLIKHPNLKLQGSYHGYFTEDSLPLKAINEIKPDLLFVGMGAPKQELWVYQNQKRLECKVAIGVGGSFDVLAGTVKRAPQWMQRTGLEWLYRYIQEPIRLKRSMFLPRFVRLVLLEKFNSLKGEGEV